jgi:hypothetical protein
MMFGVGLAVWYDVHRMIACREETGNYSQTKMLSNSKKLKEIIYLYGTKIQSKPNNLV